MKTKLTIFVLLVPLAGCYSIVSVNLGSVNHEASTTGPKMAPEVQCAALVGEAIKVGNLEAEQMEKVCSNLSATQAKTEKKKK
jgi:mRNA-degrading endonuclease toxin of MazEF toxin-antitoxin module